MKNLRIKAVIITDGKDYLIHGTNDDDAALMFKKMTALWNFDPTTDTAHFVEIDVPIPEYENFSGYEPTASDQPDMRMELTLDDIKKFE